MQVYDHVRKPDWVSMRSLAMQKDVLISYVRNVGKPPVRLFVIQLLVSLSIVLQSTYCHKSTESHK